jgi:hypothetical protein
MSTEPAVPPPLVMLGAPDAAACEDDSCLLPGAGAPEPPAGLTAETRVAGAPLHGDITAVGQ